VRTKKEKKREQIGEISSIDPYKIETMLLAEAEVEGGRRRGEVVVVVVTAAPVVIVVDEEQENCISSVCPEMMILAPRISLCSSIIT
jgi:hypothetical protein